MARMLLATLITVGVVMTIGFLFARGSGVSQATPGSHGDLVLDWEVGDNTDVSVGVINSVCQEVLSSAETVRIDVVAVNANDWAGIDFVFIYPSPVIFDRPGPGDGGIDQLFDEAAGFDFVPVDLGTGANLGSTNLMSSAAGSAVSYSTTDLVPDGASPHGISLFDNSAIGESGSGGLARLTLDISGVTAGFHTLSLGITGAFAGGVHTDASGFVPDNAPTSGTAPFASVTMAVDLAEGQSCADAPTPTSTPAPGATPTPGPGTATPTPGPTGVLGATPTPGPTDLPDLPDVGGAPGVGGGGNIWPIVAFVVGGVLLGVAAAGAIAQRLRQRTSKTQQS